MAQNHEKGELDCGNEDDVKNLVDSIVVVPAVVEKEVVD